MSRYPLLFSLRLYAGKGLGLWLKNKANAGIIYISGKKYLRAVRGCFTTNPDTEFTMSKSFLTNTYASLDNRLGRVGTPIAAAVVGGGTGAGVGYAVGGPLATYAIGGALVGVGIEEAGRLLVDEEQYKAKRMELATTDLVTLATNLFGSEIAAAVAAAK